MGLPLPPDPAKAFVAVLYRDDDALARTRELITVRVGPIDYEGGDHPFEDTDYYAEEMGRGLRRRLFSISTLLSPEEIVDVKLASIGIERDLRGPQGARRVNLDPGYLDVHKVVLASVKPGGLKVHLGRGVFADVVLRYEKGHFLPFSWTFVDFRTGAYEPELIRMREVYKRDLRRWQLSNEAGL